MMVMTIILTSTPMQAHAASKKARAIKAYKSYLTKIRTNKNYKDSRFGIAYINKDNIPELYIVYNKPVRMYDEFSNSYYDVNDYCLYLYTCSNGKVKMITI